MSYKKSTLIFNDYDWTARPDGDPKIAGSLDDTMFNRRNGYEVIYIINELMILWNFLHLREGQKMERMIRMKLPFNMVDQIAVKYWIYDNWTKY